MELFEAISKRHSYRGGFSEEAVPEGDLVKIVEAGLAAPTGKNMQTTEFVIVNDPQLVKDIAGLHTGNKALEQAKAIIVCLVNKTPEACYEGHSFEVEDCAAAVENMLLAITALGYGSVWIDGWLRVDERAEKIGRMLDIPQGKIPRVILPVGKEAGNYKQPQKKPFDQRAWFNKYGG